MGRRTRGPSGVESFLAGRDPPFCVVFYSVRFCTLTFPVVCSFSLHLGTKVGVGSQRVSPPNLGPTLTPPLEMVP